MKIGFIFSTDTDHGGVHNFSKSILFNARNYNDIVIIKYDSIRLDDIFYKKYDVIDLKKNNNLFFKVIRIILFFLNLNIDKKIYHLYPKLNDIDLFYAPTSSTFPHLYLKKPFCFTLHDIQHKHLSNNFSFTERIIRNFIFKKLSKKAFKIHCESEKVKEDIITYYKTSREKIILFPLPSLIDHKFKIKHKNSLFENIKLKVNDNFIFYPAKFWLHKNHLLLIRTANKIYAKYNLKIFFTGGNENDINKLLQLIEKYNASEYIQVTGYINSEELKFLYMNCSIVCIPSFYESISIPVLEGFLFKKLVIASNIKGVYDQFLDKRFLFDPKSEKSFMKVLEFALSNNFNKESILNKNYEYAKHKQNLGKQFLNIIAKECIK